MNSCFDDDLVTDDLYNDGKLALGDVTINEYFAIEGFLIAFTDCNSLLALDEVLVSNAELNVKVDAITRHIDEVIRNKSQ